MGVPFLVLSAVVAALLLLLMLRIARLRTETKRLRWQALRIERRMESLSEADLGDSHRRS